MIPETISSVEAFPVLIIDSRAARCPLTRTAFVCGGKPSRTWATSRMKTVVPATVRIGKEAFYRQIELPQEQAYEAMAETMATPPVTPMVRTGPRRRRSE